jgi:hypothetical protein
MILVLWEILGKLYVGLFCFTVGFSLGFSGSFRMAKYSAKLAKTSNFFKFFPESVRPSQHLGSASRKQIFWDKPWAPQEASEDQIPYIFRRILRRRFDLSPWSKHLDLKIYSSQLRQLATNFIIFYLVYS